MMTLWILFCRMNKDADMLFTFYARDREHAEEQAEGLLQKYPLYLKAYLGGFRMALTYIPGTREDE